MFLKCFNDMDNPDISHTIWMTASIKPYYGRPWSAVYIVFVQITHQIQVLTEPLCCAQAIVYALPNNERGTKYRELTYSTTFSRDLTIPHLDLSHFALCIMGN